MLLAIFWLLVTCVLRVLAARRYHALEIHDRVRESKRLRQAYIDSVRAKGGQA